MRLTGREEGCWQRVLDLVTLGNASDRGNPEAPAAVDVAIDALDCDEAGDVIAALVAVAVCLVRRTAEAEGVDVGEILLEFRR